MKIFDGVWHVPRFSYLLTSVKRRNVKPNGMLSVSFRTSSLRGFTVAAGQSAIVGAARYRAQSAARSRELAPVRQPAADLSVPDIA